MDGVLDKVKVGDKLIMTSHWNTSILTVEKVYKNFVIANKFKFRKTNGFLVTDDRWGGASATPATDKALLAYQKEVNRRKMLAKCRDIRFEELSDSQLSQILSVINVDIQTL